MEVNPSAFVIVEEKWETRGLLSHQFSFSDFLFVCLYFHLSSITSSQVTYLLNIPNFMTFYSWFVPFCKLLISTLKIEVLQSNLIRLVMITKKSLEQSGSKGNCRSEEAHKMAERDIATNLNLHVHFSKHCWLERAGRWF